MFQPFSSDSDEDDVVDDMPVEDDDDDDSGTLVETHSWDIYHSRMQTDCLRVDNFSYYKLSTDDDDDTITWRCSKRKCYATVQTNTSASTLIITNNNNNHAHSPRSNEYFIKLQTNHRVKRRASEFPDQRPAKMAILSVDEEDEDYFDDGDLDNLKKTVSRVKIASRFGNTLPKNKEEVIAALEEQLIARSAPGSSLIKCVKKGFVMLATNKSLDFLRENVYQVLGDGTFRYCPKHFYQLYTIHIFRRGFYLPVAYFLLSNKQEPTYKKMFKTLRLHVSSKMSINVMNLDFEPACMKAFKKIFPNSTVRGCRFHIAQAWQRKFREMGFQKIYNSGKGPIAKFLKSLFGIPCLPPDEVTEFFKEEFSKNAPPELSKFMQYLKTWYMMPNSTFPPHVWAGVGHENIKYTTNGCENYHRHFKDWFSSPRPDIYTFLDNLRLVTRTYNIKSNTQPKPHSIDPNTQYIRDMWEEVKHDNISKTTFISLCAKGVQPISKSRKSQTRKSQRVVRQAIRTLCSK